MDGEPPLKIKNFGPATVITNGFRFPGTKRVPLIIFLGGVNLALIQWIMVHELTMLLLGTELVILLVSVAYFAGLSLGYLWSGRIRPGWLPALAVGTLFLHLALPIALRLLSAWFYEQNVFWLAFVVLPLLMPFTVSAFYSILLPLYVDNGSGHLIDLYAVELAGAAVGVLMVISLGGLGLSLLYVPYTILLLALLASLGLRRRLLGALALVSVMWLLALPTLDARSNAYWFGKLFDLRGPSTVFSAYSPYQKVDILDDADGQRYLFLNGLIDYGTESWKRLNVVLGEVPARLLRPKSMVAVGSGSMALEGLVAAYAQRVTTVELDPVVLQASRQHFTEVNHTDRLANWSYVIDDAKHFFANTTQRYDLVAMDVPAPLTAQAATLYSAPFYGSVKARLTARGVLAVSLTRPLNPDDDVPRRIAASVLVNFKQAIAITPQSVGITFLFASDDLPFNISEVEAVLRDRGEEHYTIMDQSALRALIGAAEPITYDSLNIALQESARRVQRLVEPWSN